MAGDGRRAGLGRCPARGVDEHALYRLIVVGGERFMSGLEVEHLALAAVIAATARCYIAA